MKSLMSISLCCFLCLSFLSCDKKDNDITPVLGEAFEIKFDETITLNDSPISLTFFELVGDSRCPPTVDCFWEGEVKVQLELVIEGKEYSFSLIYRVGHPELAEAEIGDRTIRINFVDPAEGSEEVIPDEDYTLIVVIE